VIDLCFHDVGDLAVALWTAPDLAFRPERILPQFLDRWIVVRDLVGKRQIGGVEDARLAAEELEQARGLLDEEPRVGALAEAAAKEQDARCRIERPRSSAGWARRYSGLSAGK
jgi:hypothetical protein